MQLAALQAVSRGQVQTQAQLAERLLIDAPAASRMVMKLARDGLLRRCPGPDRRCVGLQVTRAGKRALTALTRTIRAFDREVRRHLSPTEYTAVLRLMRKLEAGIDAGAPRPARRRVAPRNRLLTVNTSSTFGQRRSIDRTK